MDTTRENLRGPKKFVKFDVKKELLPLIPGINGITLQFESHKDLVTVLIRAQCCIYDCI